MKYRIAIMALHYDDIHSRDVEVLEELDTLVEAKPAQLIRVQTLTGEVQYQVARRELNLFKHILTVD